MRRLASYEEAIAKGAISEAEIEERRDSIKLGDKITMEVTQHEFESQSKYPVKKKKLTVIGKYKHVLAAKDPGTGRVYTTRYIDLIINQRNVDRKAAEGNNVGRDTYD